MSQDNETEARSGGHVFVSYARADRERVRPIVEVLERLGRRVWWDHQISPGATFAREIETALRSADTVIVAWSHASVESDWVRDEAAVGRETGRLIPIRLDEVKPPLGFGQYQAIRMVGWNGRSDAPEITRLLQAIDSSPVAGRSPVATALSPARPRLSRRGLLITAGAATPVAIAAAWWAMRRAPTTGAGAPARSIAVLPFANLSGDPSQEYFSDGLTEELIGALARLPTLQVAGRTSSFKFKNSKDSSTTIGAKLGVAYLLDGSVRHGADRVRISAELVDARSGFTRWSQTYDHDMKDILATQSGIAEAVAEQLKGALVGSEIALLGNGSSANPGAYDAYLHGRRIFDLGGDEASYRAALADFDAAVAADPNFAMAHAARARALLTLGDDFSGLKAHETYFDAAVAAARRAVELAPGLAEAHATLADALSTANLDIAGARDAYAKAMATGAGQADVLARFGKFSCDIGDFTPGLAAVRRAVTLDPLNPRVFETLGRALVRAGQLDQGVATLRQALAISPTLVAAHSAIGDALWQKGDLAGASREFGLEPLDWLRLTGQAIVLRQLGDTKGAQSAFETLNTLSNVDFYQQAEVYAQWGMLDRAFAALEAGYRARDGGLVLLKTDKMVAPLRGDPRYGALLRRLGLDT